MLVRRIARPLLASVFVVEGIETLRNPRPRVDLAEPLVDRVALAAQPVAEKVAEAVEEPAEHAPTSVADTVRQVAQGQPLPFETESYVKLNAAVQVGAGLLLAAGRLPRVASAALAVTLVPTTVAGHPFWEADGAERRTQRTQFLKNAGLLGGLILAAVDTEGRPGLTYRARHAREEAKAVAAAAGISAALTDLGRAASAHGHDLVAAARESDLPDVARAKAHDLVVAARESDLPDTARAKAHDLVVAARESDLPKVAAARARELADSVRAA